MLRLLYFSTAQADLTAQDVDDIVAHSAQWNLENGITGALAYNGRNFCQLLEGEEAAVRALVKVIEADSRHSGFKVIDEKPIEARFFPDWSMHRVSDLDFSVVINAMQG